MVCVSSKPRICEICKSEYFPDGNKQKVCKLCTKERIKRYHAKFRVEFKDKIYEKLYAWRDSHPKEFKQIRDNYMKRNKDRLREKQMAFKRSPRGKEIEKKCRFNRYSKMKNIVHIFTYEEWLKKKKETKGICPMCKNYAGIDKLTLDHIVPVSKTEVVP